MTKQVFTVGYSGKSLPDIQRLIAEREAVLFDIRFKPFSQNPAFQLATLSRRLGDDYLHVGAFGNVNYKGGPIEIVDYERGRALVEASERPVILMCVCGDPTHCHRTVVAEMLRADGFEVSELGKSSAPAGGQLGLLGIL